MKKLIKFTVISFVLVLCLSAVLSTSVGVVGAVDDTIVEGLTEFRGETELVEGSGDDLKAKIGSIVQLFLSFLGILAVILILYGGFTWMTAGGDTAKVDKAKKWIINATIGIIIILGAYILTNFIIIQTTDVLET